MLAIRSLVPLPLLNSAWTSGSSWFTYCWNLAWRILSISLLGCETSAIVWLFEHCLALPFFMIRMKTDLLQSCVHCWVFQICWHVECSTVITLSFRIWNSSTWIPSPPLVLISNELAIKVSLGIFILLFFFKTKHTNKGKKSLKQTKAGRGWGGGKPPVLLRQVSWFISKKDVGISSLSYITSLL